MESVRLYSSTDIAADEQEVGQQMDFASAWTQWRAYRTSGSRPMAISTQQDYDSMYRLYIGPHFGHLPLEQVDASTVVAFQLAMRVAGVSAVRYGKIVVPLRACLRWNFRRGTFARDTSYWFDKPAPPADERKTLTFEEVERLVACLSAFYRPLVSFAAYTGLRLGELRALCWSDLDLEAGVCHVRRAMDRTVVRMYTKTKGSRAVGLPAHLRQELGAWRVLCPRGGGDLVFPSPSGTPLDPSAFRSRVFKPALASAGLDRSFRIHDLRHTAASWYVRAGANVVDLMRVFGWTQMQTALRYIHMLETPTLLADMLEASRDGHLGT